MTIGLCNVGLLLVWCWTSSSCFRLNLSSEEGVDCIKPVVQVSIIGCLDQVAALVGDDAESTKVRNCNLLKRNSPKGVWNFYSLQLLSRTVVFCTCSCKVDQSPFARVPLISEDEDVWSPDNNKSFFPSFALLL
jgi:hypothetical protein